MNKDPLVRWGTRNEDGTPCLGPNAQKRSRMIALFLATIAHQGFTGLFDEFGNWMEDAEGNQYEFPTEAEAKAILQL